MLGDSLESESASGICKNRTGQLPFLAGHFCWAAGDVVLLVASITAAPDTDPVEPVPKVRRIVYRQNDYSGV